MVKHHIAPSELFLTRTMDLLKRIALNEDAKRILDGTNAVEAAHTSKEEQRQMFEALSEMWFPEAEQTVSPAKLIEHMYVVLPFVSFLTFLFYLVPFPFFISS